MEPNVVHTEIFSPLSDNQVLYEITRKLWYWKKKIIMSLLSGFTDNFYFKKTKSLF